MFVFEWSSFVDSLDGVDSIGADGRFFLKRIGHRDCDLCCDEVVLKFDRRRMEIDAANPASFATIFYN